MKKANHLFTFILSLAILCSYLSFTVIADSTNIDEEIIYITLNEYLEDEDYYNMCDFTVCIEDSAEYFLSIENAKNNILLPVLTRGLSIPTSSQTISTDSASWYPFEGETTNVILYTNVKFKGLTEYRVKVYNVSATYALTVTPVNSSSNAWTVPKNDTVIKSVYTNYTTTEWYLKFSAPSNFAGSVYWSDRL